MAEKSYLKFQQGREWSVGFRKAGFLLGCPVQHQGFESQGSVGSPALIPGVQPQRNAQDQVFSLPDFF